LNLETVADDDGTTIMLRSSRTNSEMISGMPST